MLDFAAPFWFLALPLPAVVWFAATKYAGKTHLRPERPALVHPYAGLLTRLSRSNATSKRQKPWLWLLGCTALVVAMARPQWSDAESVNGAFSRDIMLAVDVSGSMRAQDFIIDGVVVSRLDMVKNVVTAFIQQRHGDRLGIIVFADDTYTLAPITSDLSIIQSLLEELQHGIAGEKTALGSAIALAVKRLEAQQDKQRVLIVLTDGTNTSGTIHPNTAIAMAKEKGVRIHTIGIGSQRRVAFPKASLEQPELVQMPLDENQLRRIASETGGQYFLASDSNAMQRITAEIDRLETREVKDASGGPTSEWYWIPLTIGLTLLFLSQQRSRGMVAPT